VVPTLYLDAVEKRKCTVSDWNRTLARRPVTIQGELSGVR